MLSSIENPKKEITTNDNKPEPTPPVFALLSESERIGFLKYINPGKLLAILAFGAILLTAGVICFQNRYGIYCLVGISGCMSLMFPTIYGIALQGLGDDAKFGAAGLIMAILGGSVLPPLQASVIDMKEVFSLPAVNVSFILPLICFAVVAAYGLRMYRYRVSGKS